MDEPQGEHYYFQHSKSVPFMIYFYTFLLKYLFEKENLIFNDSTT